MDFASYVAMLLDYWSRFAVVQTVFVYCVAWLIEHLCFPLLFLQFYRVSKRELCVCNPFRITCLLVENCVSST